MYGNDVGQHESVLVLGIWCDREVARESVVRAVPVIVTLIDEKILVNEGGSLVPVSRLNSFTGKLDRHAEGDGYFSFRTGNFRAV
jgi:hypothetical protein